MKGLPWCLNFVKQALFTRGSVYILEIESNGHLNIHLHTSFFPFILYKLSLLFLTTSLQKVPKIPQ